MDAFTIRDHPAAEDFQTLVNARDLAKEQEKKDHFVRDSRARLMMATGGDVYLMSMTSIRSAFS